MIVLRPTTVERHAKTNWRWAFGRRSNVRIRLNRLWRRTRLDVVSQGGTEDIGKPLCKRQHARHPFRSQLSATLLGYQYGAAYSNVARQYLGALVLALLILSGCASGSRPAQTQRSDVAPEPRAEHVAGDVHQPTITEMEESARESGVETGGGEVKGDVSTVRYGLDEEMAGLLKEYGERTVGVLGKIIGSAIVAVAGLLLWALNTNAPKNELLKTIGQIAGLATLIGGPLLVWSIT